MSGDFGPLDAKALTLVLSNPAAGIEPFGRPAVKQADGSWAVADLTIPFPGTWSVRLDIRVSDFEMVSIDDRIEIRP
jgi:copper transport protein